MRTWIGVVTSLLFAGWWIGVAAFHLLLFAALLMILAFRLLTAPRISREEMAQRARSDALSDVALRQDRRAETEWPLSGPERAESRRKQPERVLGQGAVRGGRTQPLRGGPDGS